MEKFLIKDAEAAVYAMEAAAFFISTGHSAIINPRIITARIMLTIKITLYERSSNLALGIVAHSISIVIADVEAFIAVFDATTQNRDHYCS